MENDGLSGCFGLSDSSLASLDGDTATGEIFGDRRIEDDGLSGGGFGKLRR